MHVMLSGRLLTPGLPLQGRHVEVQGHPMHVFEAGEGEPVLLLHGIQSSGYTWRLLIPELQRHCRVIVPDLPGAGRSGKRGKKLHIEALAEALVRLVDRLGVWSFSVVGHSLGGLLALRLAQRLPGRVRKVTVIQSPITPTAGHELLHSLLRRPWIQSLLVPAIRRFRHALVSRTVRVRGRAMLPVDISEFATPLGEVGGVEALLGMTAATLSPAALLAMMALLQARPPAHPVLLLWSRSDPFVAAGDGEVLHALLPGSQLRYMDAAGHSVQIEDPEGTAREILAFLREPAVGMG